MTITQAMQVALRALAANKLRSALTMLGIVIGVGAVIAMMSVGQGAQSQVTQSIRSMGTNLLFVRPGSTQQGGVRGGQGSAQTLTLEDAEALASPANAPSVSLVAPESNAFVQVIAGGANVNTRVTGTTPEYQDVRNIRAAAGEFISRQHVDRASLVVVLGANVAEQLFASGDPIDQSVRVATFSGNQSRALTFRVVGVMERKGGTGFGNQDDQIYVPLTTLQRRLISQRSVVGRQRVQTINVQVADEQLMPQAVQEIGELLRQRHRVAQDDFTILSQEDMLATANQVTGIMTILLGSIAGISLVVGGIGIMNIMLVSVTERTREIGIRKAVGAKRRDILLQFLVEAVVVSLAGGVLGLLLGVAGANVIGTLELNGQRLATVVPLEAVLLACAVSAAIGIFFGLYPATRAARLNPIEALRYE
ncbi:MAG: ABC transporter permease [Chloroflexi bacterium]|nr:ABC transporter permease [Chloroflexota bacterium]